MVVEAQRAFDAEPGAVYLARKFAVETLRAWRLGVEVEDVRLCVSELASNALLHGSAPGHRFLVRLAVVEDLLRVEVHDSRSGPDSVGRPNVRGGDARGTAKTGDTSGRGLAIVEAIADGWGVEARRPNGKITWACFKVTWSEP